jgi:hypothetical protein
VVVVAGLRVAAVADWRGLALYFIDMESFWRNRVVDVFTGVLLGLLVGLLDLWLDQSWQSASFVAVSVFVLSLLVLPVVRRLTRRRWTD